MPTQPERQAEAARRRAQILQARQAGASFEQIGRQHGISTPRAHQLYTDALRRTVQEPADQLRDLELARLDQLQLRLNQALQTGQQVIATCLALVRVSESRRKLLGLDAPTKVQADVRAEVYSVDAIDQELKQVTAELAALDPNYSSDRQQQVAAAQALAAFKAKWQQPGHGPLTDVEGFIGDALELAANQLGLNDHDQEQLATEFEQLATAMEQLTERMNELR